MHPNAERSENSGEGTDWPWAAVPLHEWESAANAH